MTVTNDYFNCKRHMVCTEKWLGHGCIPGSNFGKASFERLWEGTGYAHPSKDCYPRVYERKMPETQKKVNYRTKVVECEDCLNLYYQDCGGISHEDYIDVSEKVWFRKMFNERRECELTTAGVKLFLR